MATLNRKLGSKKFKGSPRVRNRTFNRRRCYIIPLLIQGTDYIAITGIVYLTGKLPEYTGNCRAPIVPSEARPVILWDPIVTPPVKVSQKMNPF